MNRPSETGQSGFRDTQTNTIVASDHRVMQGKPPLATDGWMSSVVSRRWQLIRYQKYGDPDF